jgi:hypothetical protein
VWGVLGGREVIQGRDEGWGSLIKAVGHRGLALLWRQTGRICVKQKTMETRNSDGTEGKTSETGIGPSQVLRLTKSIEVSKVLKIY